MEAKKLVGWPRHTADCSIDVFDDWSILITSRDGRRLQLHIDAARCLHRDFQNVLLHIFWRYELHNDASRPFPAGGCIQSITNVWYRLEVHETIMDNGFPDFNVSLHHTDGEQRTSRVLCCGRGAIDGLSADLDDIVRLWRHDVYGSDEPDE